MDTWKDVKDYEGYYQANDKGDIKSLDREFEAPCKWGGKRIMKYKGRIIKQFTTNSGYLKVQLSKNGVKTNKDVHRVVYEAFNGTIPDGMQVNHKDENKHNNCISNLELLSPKENSNYGTRIERMKATKRG